MKLIWDRIEAWLRANAPTVFELLRPGAYAEAIAETERALGVTFPDDVRASYRIHDGAESTGFIEGWELLSLERIRDEWVAWKDLLDRGTFAEARSQSDGRTLTDWWNPAWIPLTYSGSGDHHSLDLSPGLKGKRGQIIIMYHDDDSRPVVSGSFADWLSAYADDLESGRYVYSEDYGGLVHPEDVP
jgi:cell wall assembly regulator SMI1